MAEEDITRQIELNIDTIRKYLKEFDEILAGLQRPPPPEFQKEILAFSNSLSQPIHHLSLYIQDHKMGTTSSSPQQAESPSSSSSSSSRTFDSFSNRRISKAPSLVHRNLETIHCTNCSQLVPIHDFDKHSCPERREVTRISSKSYDSLKLSSNDSASLSPISADSKRSDPLFKSGSDPLPLSVPSQDASHSIPLESSSQDTSPSEKKEPSSLDSSSLSQTAPPQPAIDVSSSVDHVVPSKVLTELESPSESFENISSAPEATSEPLYIVDEPPQINADAVSASDLKSSGSKLPSEAVHLEEALSSKEEEKEEEKIPSPSLQPSDVQALDSASLLTALEDISGLPNSGPLVESFDASSLLNALKGLSETPSDKNEVVVFENSGTLAGGFDASSLLNALEGLSETTSDNAPVVSLDNGTAVVENSGTFAGNFDASSLLNSLEGLSETPSDNSPNVFLDKEATSLEEPNENLETGCLTSVVEDSDSISLEPEPSASLCFDLDSLNIDSLSAIDPLSSQASLGVNSPDLMDALATLSSFAGNVTDSQNPSSVETVEFLTPSRDRNAEVLGALAELSEFTEGLSSFETPAHSSIDELPANGVDKDTLMASLLSDASLSSFKDTSSVPVDFPTLNKDDLLASLSFNSLDPEMPFAPSEAQGDSFSLKDDLLACLSLNSFPSDLEVSNVNFSGAENLSVSGLDDLDSFGDYTNFDPQEKAPSIVSCEEPQCEIENVDTPDSSASLSLKDDLLACLSLGTAPSDFEQASVAVNETEKLSLSGLDFASLSFPSSVPNEPEASPVQADDSTDMVRDLDSLSAPIEDEDISPLPKKEVPPEVEFAEYLSNPKKKQKNYAKIGRVGGRKAKSKFDMKQVLEEVAEGQEPPEFLAMFSPSAPDSASLAEGDQSQWRIAPRMPGDPLIRDFHCSDDTNVAGLRRAKKVNFAQEFGKKKKGKPVLMEDTHYVEYPFKGNERFSLFSVFDGHVGHECAEVARDSFHKILYGIMNRHVWEDKTDLRGILAEALLEMDNSVLREFEYEGCTATATVVWQVGDDRYVQSACVGDSLSFLSRDGICHDLSECHVVANPAEKERMRAEGHTIKEGQNRVNGLSVSRALGDHFVKDSNLGIVNTPFVSEPVKLCPGDNILIVASDGLWDVATGQEAINLCRTERTARGMSSKLLKHALNSLKCNDNVTVVVAIL